MKRITKHNKRNTSIKLIGLTLALLISFVAGIITQNLYQQANNPFTLTEEKINKPKQQPTQIDPELKTIGEDLGLNMEGLSISYVDTLDKDRGGQFKAPRTIEILRGTPNVNNVLAHEYLHYIWYQLGDEGRRPLIEQLNELYSKDYGMQVRMKYYQDADSLVPGSEEFANELHSVYCTESSDSWLNAVTLEECNRWIDRSAITALR